ncbi:PREDICTED: uncharacterized protein LOC109372940 [Hipposideros armiger]|uniref:Uncharacterized protein LOC109372940 n=1 Tax=Hipposideros armiger TaxID=186990 RepID=A0A8B7Q2E0_HIPAR|nr:PREDICTED: uncharacterized protein LOC109372940 [Hipposideros armiger]
MNILLEKADSISDFESLWSKGNPKRLQLLERLFFSPVPTLSLPPPALSPVPIVFSPPKGDGVPSARKPLQCPEGKVLLTSFHAGSGSLFPPPSSVPLCPCPPFPATRPAAAAAAPSAAADARQRRATAQAPRPEQARQPSSAVARAAGTQLPPLCARRTPSSHRRLGPEPPRPGLAAAGGGAWGPSPEISLFKMKFSLAIAFFILISLCVEEACSKEKSSKKGKGKKKQYLCPSYVLHVLYSYMEKCYCIFVKVRWFTETHISKALHIRICTHLFRW